MSIEQLEVLKDSIRRERNTHNKSELVYKALEVFIELQTDESWKTLINLRNGKLDGTKIAEEICASRNIWRKENFAVRLQELNVEMLSKGLVSNADDVESKGEVFSGYPSAVFNPILEAHDVKFRAQLKRTQDKLSLANIRIQELEKRLVKFEKLSELDNALTDLRRIYT
jgi:hypothetical protein